MIVDYQYTLFVISLLCCASILWFLRKALLHPAHAAWWMIAAVLMLFAGIFPRQLDALAHYLGVTYPPTLFLFMAIVALLIRMLMSDMWHCRTIVQLRALSQHQAGLALRVRQLEQQLEAKDNKICQAYKGRGHE